jgi:hypothetical protein
MTEESFAQLVSHPLALALLTVVIAAITAALTVKLLSAGRPPAAVARGGGVPQSDASGPAVDERAVVAAIAAAVTASIGAHRIIYIGARQSGSSWATQLRSRHHASHAPQTQSRN